MWKSQWSCTSAPGDAIQKRYWHWTDGPLKLIRVWFGPDLLKLGQGDKKSGQSNPEIGQEKIVSERSGRAANAYITSIMSDCRSLSRFLAKQAGGFALLLFAEGAHSACQALHLLSTST